MILIINLFLFIVDVVFFSLCDFFLFIIKLKINLIVKVLKFKEIYKEINSYGFLYYIMNILILFYFLNKNVYEMLYIFGEF